MKRFLALFLTCTMLAACGTKQSTQQNTNSSTNDYNGPEVSADTRTDEEKELAMIQDAVSTYNDNKVSETSDYYGVTIPDLPLEVDSLPQVNSLSDLTILDTDPMMTNSVLTAEMPIDSAYTIIFTIYHATGESFWLNGTVEFQQNLDAVTVDDPQYADIRNTLSSLLSQQKTILNWFYGLNVTVGDTPVEGTEYYPVVSVEGLSSPSIAAMKEAAEKIFTADYLNASFYPSAFDGEEPMYHEINGQLCKRESDMTSMLDGESYATDYIAAVSNQDDHILIDIHTTILDQVQPTIRRIVLLNTDSGIRLSAAYE